MTETKFTPGPWWVYDEGDRYPGIESKEMSIVVFGDEDDDSGVRGENSEEALANAYLIAAAPDLYHALEVIVKNGGIGPQSMFDDARDALANACGKDNAE